MAAAAAVLCGNKRSFLFEDDVYPSSIHRPKRFRCSSSSNPPQHGAPLRRPAEDAEPESFIKRAKLSHENLNSNLNGVEEWVELFVREMSSATSVDDAKARAAKALEFFEHGIRSCAAAEAEVVAAQKEEENMVLKQEMEEMKKKIMILKGGVLNQNERLKELEGRNQELAHRENQYKVRVSELEVANYGLILGLKKADQCNNSIPLGSHPHVF